jgi:hypothetical protein
MGYKSLELVQNSPQLTILIVAIVLMLLMLLLTGRCSRVWAVLQPRYPLIRKICPSSWL